MPIPGPRPFEKVTAKDRAYSQIREWIIEGTLNPGEKLGEVDLANSISVSRTPIREALVKLNEDGFVDMEPGKITRVSSIDDEDISDLYEPMAVIEGLAASQVAASVTQEQLHELVDLENKYRKAAQGNNIVSILDADRNFHKHLLKLAENPYETQFSELLYGHIVRYEMYYFKQLNLGKDEQKSIIADHDNLLHALAEHNLAKSSASMTKDWLTTMRALKSYQDKQRPDEE